MMMFQGRRLLLFLWFGLIFTAGVIYQFLSIGQPKIRFVPPPPRKYNRSQMPSMEAIELQKLLQLLEWPVPPEDSVPFASSTSPEKSFYQLFQSWHNYTVGETLLVRLEAHDHSGQVKRYGGDFFRAKVHSPELKAGAAGRVQDHHNGTYTLAFPLLWAGAVQVSVRLIHSSEAVAILKRTRHSKPSTVSFFSYFGGPSQSDKEEKTECNVHPSPGPTCQYTDPGTGEHWFCSQPQHHPCSALTHHSAGHYKQVLTPEESVFLGGAVTDRAVPGKVPIIQVLPAPQLDAVTSPPPPPCRPGLAPISPSGFYYKDVWMPLGCSSRTFPKANLALGCLWGKIVHMFGDSTLCQWWEFLVDFIPSLKRIDLHVSYKSGPLLAVEPAQGLVLGWRAHGLPLRTEKTKMADLHYLANELDALGGGPDVVVVFTLWAHFTTFPVEYYVQRLRRVRQAVVQLLSRGPRTTVVIKTANTGYKTIYGSDWLSMQLDSILRAMFADVPVVMVDAWAMTSCHYLPDNIHPGKVIVQNEINAFLSFICPGS
ncbi:NXPE family member 3-like [Hemicordylus capensis]|uniref:NXPE family member 3-like n=1 Tax=Hemicordylus capensis TaxID=884348 RepID=UPI0023048870|nr:NXPE family member 3-like [Hemicordylus capensis]